VSHTQVIRHRKIASVSGGASKLLESAGFNAAVDYLAVYRMAQAAWWGDFYARRPGRDEWPTVAELKRAQLAAAREYIAAKHARNLAKAEARNAKRIQRHADLMRQKPGARS
jgi:hypothetical protein